MITDDCTNFSRTVMATMVFVIYRVAQKVKTLSVSFILNHV